MNASKYKYILYLIATVILCTIGIQVYWNYKNYTNNKQQLVNDVQTSLDNAVDKYYESLAKETSFGLTVKADSEGGLFTKQKPFDSLIKYIDSTRGQILEFKEYDTSGITRINILKGIQGDSLFKSHSISDELLHSDSLIKGIWATEVEENHLLTNDIKILTSKVFVSIINDSLNLKKIDSLVKLELKRKSILVDFYLDYKNPENHIEHLKVNKKWPEFDNNHNSKEYLSTDSQSSFLPPGSFLTIQFTNSTKVILNRMLVGIVISTLLVFAVISCLFYLLKIIRNQKQ